jgi:hypothetical protein
VNITRTLFKAVSFAIPEGRSRGADGAGHDIVATVSTGGGSMLSVIIATHESERALVQIFVVLFYG